jgi:phosphatidylethanolamine/phosphatidyl-N-methylethanolamine N-methyltransferase
MKMEDAVVFFKEGITRFHDTGSICATSAVAARVMCRPIYGTRKRLNILEVGAGTGSVTLEILRHLRHDDHLTICELNERFVEQLLKKLEKNSYFIKHRSQISIFTGSIQDLPRKTTFEVVISSLPFLNFTPELIDSIFDKLRELTTEEAVMTYYEYIGLRKLGLTLSPPDRKRRLQEIDSYFKQIHNSQMSSKTHIWWNFLPITIHTLPLHSSNTNQAMLGNYI